MYSITTYQLDPTNFDCIFLKLLFHQWLSWANTPSYLLDPILNEQNEKALTRSRIRWSLADDGSKSKASGNSNNSIGLDCPGSPTCEANRLLKVLNMPSEPARKKFALQFSIRSNHRHTSPTVKNFRISLCIICIGCIPIRFRFFVGPALDPFGFTTLPFVCREAKTWTGLSQSIASSQFASMISCQRASFCFCRSSLEECNRNMCYSPGVVFMLTKLVLNWCLEISKNSSAFRKKNNSSLVDSSLEKLVGIC